uniref:Uncharacterized protein n=1 Tax=Manihot esculenta TaxID=3983 RepID=A0A251LT22_MANES
MVLFMQWIPGLGIYFLVLLYMEAYHLAVGEFILRMCTRLTWQQHPPPFVICFLRLFERPVVGIVPKNKN